MDSPNKGSSAAAGGDHHLAQQQPRGPGEPGVYVFDPASRDAVGGPPSSSSALTLASLSSAPDDAHERVGTDVPLDSSVNPLGVVPTAPSPPFAVAAGNGGSPPMLGENSSSPAGTDSREPAHGEREAPLCLLVEDNMVNQKVSLAPGAALCS